MEAFFCEIGLATLTHLAQSVAVAASVVCQNAPANLGINVIHTIMDEVTMLVLDVTFVFCVYKLLTSATPPLTHCVVTVLFQITSRES